MSGPGTAEAIALAAAPGDERYEPRLTDWTLRPFSAARVSPFLVALAFALAFAALSQCVRIAIGESTRWPYLWLDLLNGVLFAYVPTALWLLRRARLRELRLLRPALREGVSFAGIADAVLCVPPRRLALSGLAGAVVFGALPTVDPAFWEGPAPALTHPFMLFFVARMAVTGWLGGRAVASELTAIAAFYRIGAERVRVDLQDLRPFEGFARGGLRSAFAWVLGSSLVSLFWLGPGAGSANAFIVATILTGVTAGLFASVYGPHRAIAGAKRETLAALEARIARAGAALGAGREPADAGVRLADLVAWHAVLERVREWPIGAPALARGALIAALAIGSWLGGALVERLVARWVG